MSSASWDDMLYKFWVLLQALHKQHKQLLAFFKITIFIRVGTWEGIIKISGGKIVYIFGQCLTLAVKASSYIDLVTRLWDVKFATILRILSPRIFLRTSFVFANPSQCMYVCICSRACYNNNHHNHNNNFFACMAAKFC
jgi:hypothetical protein